MFHINTVLGVVKRADISDPNGTASVAGPIGVSIWRGLISPQIAYKPNPHCLHMPEITPRKVHNASGTT